jgi:hypothetical protein
MDEKEKKKAEQGPAWWYEPRGSKVREYGTPVERSYCKRPIQCLASSKILTPTLSPPGERVPPPPLVQGEDTLAGWRGGGSIFWKTPDTALYSTYVSTLWVLPCKVRIRIRSSKRTVSLAVFRLRIGSGFSWVSGSGSRQAKNLLPKKGEKVRISCWKSSRPFYWFQAIYMTIFFSSKMLQLYISQKFFSKEISGGIRIRIGSVFAATGWIRIRFNKIPRSRPGFCEGRSETLILSPLTCNRI